MKILIISIINDTEKIQIFLIRSMCCKWHIAHGHYTQSDILLGIWYLATSLYDFNYFGCPVIKGFINADYKK